MGIYLRFGFFKCPSLFFVFLKILFIYLFLEGKGGREENINVWLPLARPLQGTLPATQACALTGIRPATLWHAGQPQSTEPHQPEQNAHRF